MTTTEPAPGTADPQTNGHPPLPADVTTRAVRALIATAGSYTCDDVGNATRLVDGHADKAAWVPEARTWRTWNGDRWINDVGKGRMHAVAHQVTETMHREATDRIAKADRALPLATELARREATEAGSADIERSVTAHPLVREVEAAAKEAREARKWARDSRFASRLTAMVTEATGVRGDDGRPRVEVPDDRWDADPTTLNVANGTLELRPDGAVLRPHAAQDRLTQLAPVDYTPDAPAPRWGEFLTWAVPNLELREQLQAELGQSLFGGNPHHHLPMLIGSTRSGKTTLFEVVAGVLGPDYAASFDLSLLRSKREAAGRPDMVRVLDKRFIYTTEASDGWTLDGEQVKRLSGGDTLSVRDNYARADDFRSRRPAFTAWIASNAVPDVTGADPALYDERLVPLPFNQYCEADERNPHLVRELVRDEAPGILAWLVAGWNLGQRRPKLLTTPSKVSAELAQDVRKELSAVDRWLAERCETCPEDCKGKKAHECGETCPPDCEGKGKPAPEHCTTHHVSAAELWSSYKTSCKDAEETSGTRTAFGRALNQRGYPGRDPKTRAEYFEGKESGRYRVRRGLRLNPLGL